MSMFVAPLAGADAQAAFLARVNAVFPECTVQVHDNWLIVSQSLDCADGASDLLLILFESGQLQVVVDGEWMGYDTSEEWLSQFEVNLG